MSPTIKDIAKRCKVSTATVSLVLNNNPRISTNTKNKVLKVIKELGYYPNLTARWLVTRTTKTLCIVIPEISHIFSNPYFGEILSGIYDVASENDYKILIEVATHKFCAEKNYLNLFKEHRIDGMFYVGSTLRDTYLKDFLNENFPFIQVGSYLPGLNLNYVTGDNIRGGYLATKHLFEHGHKKIALITGNFNVISAKERFIGYKKALKEAGILFNKEFIVMADFDESTGYTAMKHLLNMSKNQRPTAIFAGNDLMALGAVRAIKETGAKIPDDFAVIGMDNLRLSSIGETKLSTVEYNVYKMGKIACEKIIELIKNKKKNVNSVVKEILPVELVLRESCCGKK